MKRLNKKGFTLIELLAVIVILAILLGVAIPAVSNYINSSRKSGFIDNILMYVDAARTSSVTNEFVFPTDANAATVISFEELLPYLDKSGEKSSYGREWDDNSYIIVVNEGTADKAQYEYYVAASDGKNVLGNKDESDKAKRAQIINVDILDTTHVVQGSAGAEIPATGDKYNTASGILTAATDGAIIIEENSYE